MNHRPSGAQQCGPGQEGLALAVSGRSRGSLESLYLLSADFLRHPQGPQFRTNWKETRRAERMTLSVMKGSSKNVLEFYSKQE